MDTPSRANFVDDLRDPRIALFAGVADAELLRAHGLFAAEGRVVVRRLLDDARYRIRAILLNPAAARHLASCLTATDAPVYVARPDDFATLTGYNFHRGCLALVERPAPLPTEALHEVRLLVVLDGVSNADNVGGIFRNAAAFGAGGVLLDPASCDPLYRKAIRTSMAAALRIPFARARDWPVALAALRAAGFTLVALTPGEPSEPIEEVAHKLGGSKVALVVGNEGAGLSAAAIAAADYRARIATSGDVDSLNVAVATGIALHRLGARGDA